MSSKPMNIYDIARLSGVSIATVSRVMNGSDKVSEKTRQRVLDVIEKTGFTPNVFAQGLGLNTMHTIGILVPDISDLYMSSSVNFLEKELHEKGYEVLLSCSGFSLENKSSHVQMLLTRHIDALILVGSTYAGDGSSKEQTEYIRQAAETVPVFLINGLVEGDHVYCIVSDDKSAVMSVTSALIRRGHKEILFLSNSHSYSAQQKLSGYEGALRRHHLPVRGELKLFLGHSRIHYVQDLLLGHQDLSFDAVIATDDALAVGALKYTAIRGLKVPQQVEIVGYNNSILSVAAAPEITSIDVRLEDLCHECATGILQVLSGGRPESKTVITPDIIKRSTTDF